ncbi:MAG: phenylalanine--tRNA ligase subunit beta, partial [Acidimicrobiales bacterium]
MKILYSWLVEFFEPRPGAEAPSLQPSPSELNLLVDALNSLGMVVESVERVPAPLNGVVVAEVAQIDEIEGADHIRHVLVHSGQESPVSVVCGATNFAVGDRVPFAQVGAVLPGEFRIERRTMMGKVSNGMLCSARELELSDDGSGLMILPADAPVGGALAKFLGLEEEIVIDLAIEANRPDANSVAGVARDVAPTLGFVFRSDGGIGAQAPVVMLRDELDRSSHGECLIGEVDLAAVSRIVAAKFQGPFALVDPTSVRRRLQLCGMRSISPVVDASNYVMIEMGQPTHPYDLRALSGSSIGVRNARDGERLKTLDGEERVLQGTHGEDLGDIVIVDADSTPVGLAGVMGGDSSVITEETTSVLLELACFPRSNIARTSKRLGLRSEASARFERGVDPNAAEWALQRFCELLAQEPLAVDSAGPTPVPSVTVSLRLAQIERLLGRSFEIDHLRRLLEPCGFLVGDGRDDVTEVVVPSFRPDCTMEADIIEEIARHEGYRSLGERRIQSPYVGKLTPYQRDLRKIGDFLVSHGYFELMGSALVNDEDSAVLGLSGPSIRASNPLSAEESVLRRTLASTALAALRFNAARRRSEVALFEIGEVFSMPVGTAMLPDETTRLGVMTTSPENGAAPLVGLLADLALVLGSLEVEI